MFSRHQIIDLKIPVNRKKLLWTLQSNLENHRTKYNEALEAYYKKLVEFLEKNLEAARKLQKVDKNFPTRPVDYIDEYERVIGMLELSNVETVDLTAEDYKHFVMDEWAWKRDWEIINSSYIGAQNK